MSEVFVSTDEIHVDVVIEAFEEIVAIEVGVQGPRGPAGSPGPVGPFDEGAILTGAGEGNPHSSLATVTAAGDIGASSVTVGGIDDAGGYWLSSPVVNQSWGWYATATQLHLARVGAAGVIDDSIEVDYATGVVGLPKGATVPTAAPGDNDTSIATTAFVTAAIAAAGGATGDITSVTAGGGLTGGGTTGAVTLALADPVLAGTFRATGAAGNVRLEDRTNSATGYTLYADSTFRVYSLSQAADRMTLSATGNLVLSGGLTLGTPLATATIADGAVTYAKQQNVTAARLIGNPTGSAAAPSEITLGTNLSFAGSVLNATAGAGGLSGMVAGQIPIAATATTVTSSVSALAASFMPAHTGDVTSPAGSIVNTLATVNSNIGTFNNITINGKGLATAGSNTAYLTASGVSGMAAGQIPIAATATTITSSGNLSGAVTTSGSLATTLANNAVATTNITNANVTYAKIQNVAANRLLGNATGSAAAPAEIALPLAVALGGTGSTTASVSGPITTLSATGGYTWEDRTTAGAGHAWQWYSSADIARLYNGVAAADVATITTGGNLTLAGMLTVGNNAKAQLGMLAAQTSLWGPDGGPAAQDRGLFISNTATGQMTRRHTTHLIQDVSGSSNFIQTSAAGTVVGAPAGGAKGVGTLNAVGVYGAGVLLTSDERLKTDIEKLPPCLALVEAVEPKTYRWAVPEELPERPNGEGRLSREEMAPAGFYEASNRGFLAQDVAAVFGGADDAIDLGGMVAVLWRAVQELSAKVAALEGAGPR